MYKFYNSVKNKTLFLSDEEIQHIISISQFNHKGEEKTKL